MNAPVRPSIILSFRPISCFRSWCSDCYSSSACAIWSACSDACLRIHSRNSARAGRTVAPLLAEHLHRKRTVKAGARWYVDGTYLKVKGRWCYFYLAPDRECKLVDSMLSATRDMEAAQRFFRGTLSVVDRAPQQVTSDGHDSYPRAIREVLGHKVEHRCSMYLNRWIEQDNRGVKQRYYPMLGFGAFHSPQRFCRAFEEMRQYIRPPAQKKAIRFTRTLQTTILLRKYKRWSRCSSPPSPSTIPDRLASHSTSCETALNSDTFLRDIRT
jgi:transposase-like protein